MRPHCAAWPYRAGRPHCAVPHALHSSATQLTGGAGVAEGDACGGDEVLEVLVSAEHGRVGLAATAGVESSRDADGALRLRGSRESLARALGGR